MNRRLLLQILVFFTVVIILYLLWAFIMWNILWIREIPSFDPSERAMLVICEIGIPCIMSYLVTLKDH